ncbi:MAG: flavoprotein [Promethearchaeota archaeon]
MRKKDIINLKLLERRKIAWGICGASHLLFDSVDTIKKLIEEEYSVDIYFSRAGREVAKMFRQLSILEKLYNENKDKMKLIFAEKQGWSYPVCGKFSLKAYDILIISPTTANTVAKLAHKIADTLITNIVNQALKGKTPVIIIPTDFKVGKCKTISIDNQEIEIFIHKSDVKLVKSLKKIKGLCVIENPKMLIF